MTCWLCGQAVPPDDAELFNRRSCRRAHMPEYIIQRWGYLAREIRLFLDPTTGWWPERVTLQGYCAQLREIESEGAWQLWRELDVDR